MHFLLDLILNNFQLEDVTYVSIASLIGIIILLVFSYLLFVVIMAIKEPKPDADFEFTLIRKYVWAWIYVFNCFWLSAEVIACWKLNWLDGIIYYIPIWIIFVFSAIMALIMAFPFKKRANYLKKLTRQALQTD